MKMNASTRRDVLLRGARVAAGAALVQFMDTHTAAAQHPTPGPGKDTNNLPVPAGQKPSPPPSESDIAELTLREAARAIFLYRGNFSSNPAASPRSAWK